MRLVALVASLLLFGSCRGPSPEAKPAAKASGVAPAAPSADAGVESYGEAPPAAGEAVPAPAEAAPTGDDPPVGGSKDDDPP